MIQRDSDVLDLNTQRIRFLSINRAMKLLSVPCCHGCSNLHRGSEWGSAEWTVLEEQWILHYSNTSFPLPPSFHAALHHLPSCASSSSCLPALSHAQHFPTPPVSLFRLIKTQWATSLWKQKSCTISLVERPFPVSAWWKPGLWLHLILLVQ